MERRRISCNRKATRDKFFLMVATFCDIPTKNVLTKLNKTLHTPMQALLLETVDIGTAEQWDPFARYVKLCVKTRGF